MSSWSWTKASLLAWERFLRKYVLGGNWCSVFISVKKRLIFLLQLRIYVPVYCVSQHIKYFLILESLESLQTDP